MTYTTLCLTVIWLSTMTTLFFCPASTTAAAVVATDVTPSDSFHCPLCNHSQCDSTGCNVAAPYACIAGSAKGGCASEESAWENPSVCSACCSVLGCEIPCPSCGPLICKEKPLPCSDAAPYLCTAGKDAGACGVNQTWRDTALCDACCDMQSCYGNETDSPGAPPPHNSSNPTTCDNLCNASMCADPPCGRSTPFYCATNQGCGINTTWVNNSACDSCCSLDICYPPRPSSPWDIVPNSTNCTLNEGGPYLSPPPGATPFGAMDVSDYGCRVDVGSSCCGFTPRFNWVLSTCHTNASNRVSMACAHNNSNTTALDLYYVNAYQWNGTHWIKDPTSSIHRKPGEDYVRFDEGYFVGGGYRQDWDLKYGPTTNYTDTAGLGPPGFLFVLSAHQFSWSAFYALNQITVNRGPGGEVVAINCWEDSSGELDFIESPFWADVIIPPERLYLTITADAGRCFPVQKNVPQLFNKHCTSKYCCEMCSCPNGTVCFGKEEDIGFEPMGCIPEQNISQVPKHSKIFEVDGDKTACGKYFGGVSGGSTSNGFFNQRNENGTGEVIYAAMVDRTGVHVFRWATDGLLEDGSWEEEEGPSLPYHPEKVWPGIGKFDSAEILHATLPDLNIFRKEPPCTKWNEPCVLFEPSCVGDCPLVSAAGDFGPDELAGGYSAEAARDGLNWWDLFDEIYTTKNISVEDLPIWDHVPTFTPPLPFYCNHSCEDFCHDVDRCPDSQPFMCTKGDARGGCTNQSHFWPLSPHCGLCCNVSLCGTPCTKCNASICAADICPLTAPYVCTSGPEERGCTSTSTWWPEQAACDSCCNLSSCFASSSSSSSASAPSSFSSASSSSSSSSSSTASSSSSSWSSSWSSSTSAPGSTSTFSGGNHHHHEEEQEEGIRFASSTIIGRSQKQQTSSSTGGTRSVVHGTRGGGGGGKNQEAQEGQEDEKKKNDPSIAVLHNHRPGVPSVPDWKSWWLLARYWRIVIAILGGIGGLLIVIMWKWRQSLDGQAQPKEEPHQTQDEEGPSVGELISINSTVSH